MCRYKEEDYLLLSGLQHFEFCPRQWALIHIEQQWAENLHTTEGKIMHERAHDKDFAESRKDVIISGGISVFSSELGVTGECDIVEFRRDENGIQLFGREGKFIPIPIEYKKGKPKEGKEDILQLTCQAMCLEEMLCCNIEYGFLYYGETRKREKVIFDTDIRQKVKDNLKLMHQYYKRAYTPNTKQTVKCRACSLNEICVPKRNKYKSVSGYISERLGDDE